MSLPPLYKYLDVNGAKLTLGSRTFRHAKPSTFNDLEDMTVQNVFPEGVEAALATLSNGSVDVILENVNEPPTCSERLRDTVAELQAIFRENPNAADAVREEFKNNPEINLFDVGHMRSEVGVFLKDINEFMQRHRVLCVTTDKVSERMWKEYAENHKGIVLRIEGNVAKDSKFRKFAPVTYYAARPPLYDQTLDFMRAGLFGDQEATKQAMMDKIIYAKKLAHQFESEYRLVIPVRANEDWSALLYHPEEITELYLGSAMTKDQGRQG
jgi:Protein of unknown function (DUF2971)